MVPRASLLLLLGVQAAVAFAPAASLSLSLGQPRQVLRRTAPHASMSQGTEDRINEMVTNNKVMVFMKGNRIFPQVRLTPQSSFTSRAACLF
jgi:hypothetical protein